MLASETRDEIKQSHWKHPQFADTCGGCLSIWPCDSALLLEALDVEYARGIQAAAESMCTYCASGKPRACHIGVKGNVKVWHQSYQGTPKECDAADIWIDEERRRS